MELDAGMILPVLISYMYLAYDEAYIVLSFYFSLV